MNEVQVMKKKKIICAIAIICCSMLFGVFLGKLVFRARAIHNNAETNDISIEQNLYFTSDTDTDILSRHALPSLERMEKRDQDEFVNNLQVIKKAELLGIGKHDFLYPEISIANIENNARLLNDGFNSEREVIVFQGITSEELQQTINDNPNTIIDIHAERIELHDTIVLQNDTILHGNGVTFVGNDLAYGFIAEGKSNIYLNDICITGAINYGIYFTDCNNISISECDISGLLQKPVCVIGTTSGLNISNNKMCENLAGGLYIAGDVSNGIINSNDIINNGGASNWMAGIVLTDVISTDKRNIWEAFDEAHHFPNVPHENLLECPHQLIVSNNRVMNNNSSGIYSDGAYLCYVLNNTVFQNDKEGMCLDYSTIGFYLKENVFEGNGQRMRQTDENLSRDFVLEAGRMEDGSAKSKLPGISLDNTAYNILENNIVISNYGGGIKMVRTTVRTLIMENIVKDNNMGQNDIFHFFGIELGAAAADEESDGMDFKPDYENIICRNSITGNHYSGIFVGEDCYVNDIFDNVIMESQMFAIEAISHKFNSIVNNIYTSGIRNEYAAE